MKIILRNEPPAEAKPLWVGLKIICGNCKSKFELEEGDPVSTATERRLGGKTCIAVTCPVCKCSAEKILP